MRKFFRTFVAFVIIIVCFNSMLYIFQQRDKGVTQEVAEVVNVQDKKIVYKGLKILDTETKVVHDATKESKMYKNIISDELDLLNKGKSVANRVTTVSNIELVDQAFNISKRKELDTVENKNETSVWDKWTGPKIWNPLNQEPPVYLKDYKNPCWEDNSTIHCLPYWFMVGFQKCGTTDMYASIYQHPMADMAMFKEPYFWTRGRFGYDCLAGTTFKQYLDIYKWSALRIRNYKVKNPDTGQMWHPKITGEAAVGYAWDNYNWMYEESNRGEKEAKYLIPHYIHHFVPNAKIIFAVRNPVERILSGYRFYQDKTKETMEEFHNKMSTATSWMSECFGSGGSRRHCMYDPPPGQLPPRYMDANFHWHPLVRLRIGMYIEYIKDWLEVFPREQILVISFERYIEDRVAVSSQIYDFLGLPPLPSSREEKLEKAKIWNQTKKKTLPVFNKTLEMLHEFYQPYNDELAQLLKDEHYRWL